MLPTCGALPTVRRIAWSAEADPQLSTSGGGTELCQPLVAVETLLDGTGPSRPRSSARERCVGYLDPQDAHVRAAGAQRVEHRQRRRGLRLEPVERSELDLAPPPRRGRPGRAPGRPGDAGRIAAPGPATPRAARRARRAPARARRAIRGRRDHPRRSRGRARPVVPWCAPAPARPGRARPRGWRRCGAAGPGDGHALGHPDDDRRRQVGGHVRPGDGGESLRPAGRSPPRRGTAAARRRGSGPRRGRPRLRCPSHPAPRRCRRRAATSGRSRRR